MSKPEKEFHVMEEMYVASLMRMCAQKTTFLAKDDYASIMYYEWCIMHHASCIVYKKKKIM